MSQPNSNSKAVDNLPWYKQFWPWFIIAIPLSAVIAGIAMIIVSVDGADTLVKEDYYKEGLAINKQFEKSRKASELEITAEIVLIEGKLSLSVTSAKPIVENLSLDFRHATIDSKDFSVKLQQTSNGKYFALLSQQQLDQIMGKWYLTLSPFSSSWHLKSQWTLPNKSPLMLGVSRAIDG